MTCPMFQFILFNHLTTISSHSDWNLDIFLQMIDYTAVSFRAATHKYFLG